MTKTQLVLQYGADPTSKHYKGMVDALVKIYRSEGVPGLYRVRPLFVLPHTAVTVSRSGESGANGVMRGSDVQVRAPSLLMVQKIHQRASSA